MTGPCGRCRAPAEHGHHPTGRLDGRYLDPHVVVALCRRCHTEHHGIQGVLGLDRAPAGLSGFEAVEVALRRAGLTLTRLDAMPEWVRRLGEALVRLADVVAAGVAALDHQYPDWRLAGRALPTGVECP